MTSLLSDITSASIGLGLSGIFFVIAVGLFIVLLVFSVIGSMLISALVGAMIIRLGTEITRKFTPTFGVAYRAAFLSYIGLLMVGILFAFKAGLFGNIFWEQGTINIHDPVLAMALFVASQLFVSAAILTMKIKSYDGKELTFGSACIICLIHLPVSIAIMAICLNGGTFYGSQFF